MKKIVISLLAVLAFSWASGVAADQSPESIVSCSANATPYLVLGDSIPETINAGQCKTWTPDHAPDRCAPCINSLENQGCKIADVIVKTIPELTVVTYLLSCVKP